MFKMSSYNEYIAKSRYARYLDKEGRREHWPETVERYLDFMKKHPTLESHLHIARQ